MTADELEPLGDALDLAVVALRGAEHGQRHAGQHSKFPLCRWSRCGRNSIGDDFRR